MRLKWLILLVLIGALLIDVDAMSRKRKKQHRTSTAVDDDEEGAGESPLERESEKKKERAEREREREKEKEKKEKDDEKSSSESKEKEEEGADNSTATAEEAATPLPFIKNVMGKEINVPLNPVKSRSRRHEVEHTLTRTKDINDDEVYEVPEKYRAKPKTRRRRYDNDMSLAKAKELNDGEQKPVDKRPTQDKMSSRRRRCDCKLKGHDHKHDEEAISRRRRHDHELTRTKDINDDEKTEVANKPKQETMHHRVRRCDCNLEEGHDHRSAESSESVEQAEQAKEKGEEEKVEVAEEAQPDIRLERRRRHEHELARTRDINDGEKTDVANKPRQETMSRRRRSDMVLSRKQELEEDNAHHDHKHSASKSEDGMRKRHAIAPVAKARASRLNHRAIAERRHNIHAEPYYRQPRTLRNNEHRRHARKIARNDEKHHKLDKQHHEHLKNQHGKVHHEKKARRGRDVQPITHEEATKTGDVTETQQDKTQVASDVYFQ